MTTGIHDRARHPILGAWILMGRGFGVAVSPRKIPVRNYPRSSRWARPQLEERLPAAARRPDATSGEPEALRP